MCRLRRSQATSVRLSLGSLTTALAPNLGILLFGWSLLEGIGAALIMPAIVALVAGNFPPERRSSACGLIAAAGAIAVAVGPLIGGAVTTFASWRLVFGVLRSSVWGWITPKEGGPDGYSACTTVTRTTSLGTRGSASLAEDLATALGTRGPRLAPGSDDPGDR